MANRTACADEGRPAGAQVTNVAQDRLDDAEDHQRESEGHGEQEPGPQDAQPLDHRTVLNRGQERPDRQVEDDDRQNPHKDVADQQDDGLGARRKEVDDHVDADVGALAHRRGGPDPHQIDEHVTGRLLAPDGREVEAEAAHDLDEDDHDDVSVEDEQQPPLTVLVELCKEIVACALVTRRGGLTRQTAPPNHVLMSDYMSWT
jgi:hypothetical protein